jgi:DNA-binding CsgD family transcriptional regulator
MGGGTEPRAVLDDLEQANSGVLAHQLLAVAMGRLRRGMLIADADLRVRFCNKAAHEIVLKADAVVIAEGRLVLRHRDAMLRLQRYLDSGRSGSDKGASLALRLDRSNGERAYRMWASPLSFLDGTGVPGTYLVMIFNPDTARRIEGRVLMDLYGLTPAEAGVSIRLFQGLTVGEAAADMQISTNTARTHLRSIFRKCEVDSQSQLVQLMSLGPRGD